MALAATAAIPVLAGEDAGATLYQRCAACHLADGAGVPGVYPPLAGRLGPLASTEVGRRYLITVVAHGLAGTIEVQGQTYRNVMPAQGAALDAGGIAAVLNHVLATLNATSLPADWQRFTTEEVKQTLARHPKADGRTALHMRAAVFAARGDGQ